MHAAESDGRSHYPVLPLVVVPPPHTQVPRNRRLRPSTSHHWATCQHNRPPCHQQQMPQERQLSSLTPPPSSSSSSRLKSCLSHNSLSLRSR